MMSHFIQIVEQTLNAIHHAVRLRIYFFRARRALNSKRKLHSKHGAQTHHPNSRGKREYKHSHKED